MKKGAIARIIIWSVTAFILIGIMISVIITGGFGRIFRINNWSFSIGSNGGTYANADSYSVGNASISDKIEDIDVNWISGSVNIEAYDGETIEISENQIEDDEYKLRYLVDGNKLIIQYKESGWSIGITNTPSKNLTLKIPKSYLEDMKKVRVDSTSAEVDLSDINTTDAIIIDTVSGDINLNSIHTNRLEIDATSGSTTAKNVKVEELNTDAVSGSVKFNGEVKQIDTGSTSGSISITSSVFPTKVDTDSVSGDVKLTIPEGNGFTVEFDSVSGDFNSDFAYKSKGDKHIYGDGSADYEFDSTSGDVTINMLNADS